MISSNLTKHQTQNPVQQYLLDRFHARIDALIIRTNPATVLDVGCGEGFTLARLGGRKSIGADASPDALRWASRHRVQRVPLLQAELPRLPFRDASVALVLCLEVLEHLDNPAAALAELRRVAGRYVLVSVPHEPWFRSANFLRGRHWRRWGNHPEHRQTFTGQAFRCLLGEGLVWHGYSFPWQIGLIATSPQRTETHDTQQISPPNLELRRRTPNGRYVYPGSGRHPAETGPPHHR